MIPVSARFWISHILPEHIDRDSCATIYYCLREAEEFRKDKPSVSGGLRIQAGDINMHVSAGPWLMCR